MSSIVETIYRIVDDSGEFIQVGPDGDGLELVDIRQYAVGGKTVLAHIILDQQAAEDLANSILKYLKGE